MSQEPAAAAQVAAQLEEIVQARWTPEVFKRFQCVWLLHFLNLPVPEVAKALDLNVSTVRRIRTEFARDGVRAIDGKGNRGGRRNQCMSLEEEAAFLRNHPECFNRSGVADVGSLKAAFEERVGRRIHKTTVYRLLERHGRRKTVADAVGAEAAPAVPRRKRASGQKRRLSRGR